MAARTPVAARLRAALALIVAAGLSACGPPPAPSDRAGSTLREYALRVRSLDPVRSSDVNSALAIARIYETPLQYVYLERPHRVVPLLAEAMPEISADGLTYTFKIRRGIFFQDDPCFTRTGGRGRELTAGDFVYSIKRIADAKNASTGLDFYGARIRGLKDFYEASRGDAPTDYDRVVEGLTAPDDRTLVVRLVEPYPQLLWVMAMHYSAAVPREAVEHYGREFVSHPVGTGAYMLEAWNRNYKMVFTRSPKWAETGRAERYPGAGAPEDAPAGRLADAGRALPFCDRIVDYIVADTSTQWLMFLRGEIDWAEISRDNWLAVVTPDRKLRPELAAQGMQLVDLPELVIRYIGFNMDDPLWGRNKKLRQAMTSAFNHAQWLQLNHRRIKTPTMPIAEGMNGWEDRPLRFPFDLERARRLMAEAGYPEGRDPATGKRLEITLDIGRAEDAEVRQSVELIADMMLKIGVVMKFSFMNWPTFIDKVDRRQSQLFYLGWTADYPDAENFLMLFYGPNSSPGTNHSNFVNPEFDAMYEQARTLQDSPERTALYRRMCDLVMEECPWILHSSPCKFIVHHGWLHNYKLHDFPYGMEKFMRVDEEARARWLRGEGR